VTLGLPADRLLLRAGERSRRFVCAEIQAPDAPTRPGRLPVNLCFVLDRSGSMHGDKIKHAREAILQGIRSLRDQDRFAVVAYDDEIDVVVPTGPATPPARTAAARAVARIEPRRHTDLEGGWRRGCEQVAEQLTAEAVGRCLLLTDGLANAGEKNHDEIVKRCGSWRERRVTTSTFGVGADFDETLLRRMADAGGGNFQFIESAVQIADFMASEVGEALAIAVREVVLVVEAGEGAVVESLNDFPCQKDGTAWRVQVGSLFGGQSLDPVVRITVPAGETGATRDVSVRLEDADGTLGQASASLQFTCATKEQSHAQPRDRSVDRRVAALYAARAERDALERNRAGDFEGAARIMRGCVEHIRRYARDDATILSILEDLGHKVHQYSQDMDSISRKTLHSLSSRSLTLRPMPSRPSLALTKVRLVAPRALSSVLQPVIGHLAGADAEAFGQMAFDAAPPTPAADAPPLTPEQERPLLDDFLQDTAPAAVRIVFTTQRLLHDAFSHWHDSRQAALVSLAPWSGIAAIPVEAFLAFEILFHGLRALGSGWLPERLLHSETRGCIFDFCATRQEMERVLQAADLCPDCRAALGRASFPVERVERLAKVVRSLATPAVIVH
jgi:Ca-activated chloride channel family protein